MEAFMLISGYHLLRPYAPLQYEVSYCIWRGSEVDCWECIRCVGVILLDIWRCEGRERRKYLYWFGSHVRGTLILSFSRVVCLSFHENLLPLFIILGFAPNFVSNLLLLNVQIQVCMCFNYPHQPKFIYLFSFVRSSILEDASRLPIVASFPASNAFFPSHSSNTVISTSSVPIGSFSFHSHLLIPQPTPLPLRASALGSKSNPATAQVHLSVSTFLHSCQISVPRHYVDVMLSRQSYLGWFVDFFLVRVTWRNYTWLAYGGTHIWWTG